MRKRAAKLLINLGIPADLTGFTYICDAMEIYFEDETYISSKKISLYQKIGEMHDTTSSSVERGIRHAFEKMIHTGDMHCLGRYWSDAQRLSNSNLLACMYLKLKDEMENEDK